MSKRRGTLLGLTLGGAVAVMLPVLLGASAGREDLVVNFEGTRAFELLLSPDAARLGAVTTPPNVDARRLLLRGQSGLDLTTWNKTYGGAYLREVTWPSLVGPFQNETDDVCGYSLYLGAGLFDTSGAGSGLQRVIRDRIVRQFPYHSEVQGIDVSLPAVATSNFTVTLGSGKVDLALTLHLVDTTLLAVEFPVRLVTRNRAPYVERIREAPMTVRFEGPSRERIMQQARDQGGGMGALGGAVAGCLAGPIGCFLGALLGGAAGESAGESEAQAQIPKNAQDIAAAKVDAVLKDVALGMEHFREPFRPVSSRPDDELRLRLDADPIVAPTGISLPLCVRVKLSQPKVNPAVPGGVLFGSERLLHGDSGSTDPVLGLAMNADAVNQVVYYLWQSGLLRHVGESSLVLDALTREVRMAAFDFTGLDPGLPPTLTPSAAASGSGLPFVLGNVQLGTMGRRTVMGHGQAALSVVQEGDSILLQGSVDDVRLNCTELVEAGIKFTPCLADLLPVVRSVAGDPEKRPSYRFSGADVLGKLPQLGFQGMRLGLSNLRVNTEGNPVRIDLSVHAQIN